MDEKNPSKGGAWEVLKQTAGFIGSLTNRWLQDMETEHQLTKQALIEKDIQEHLDRISSLLLEQDSMDASEAPQFDLAVKYQLNRIQELLEDNSGRHNSGRQHQVEVALPVPEDQPAQRDLASSHVSHRRNFQQNEVVVGVDRIARSDQDPAALNKVFSRVRHNRYKEVEAILDTGVSPDVRDQHGNTLMILACQNGNKRIVKICLRRCCDMDAQNLRGQTALHYCFAFNYRELGEYLISKGARDDLTNEYGMTCYDGLEPAEVRLHTTSQTSFFPSRPQQMYPHGRPPVDDDTESLTSTTSGFSTDTTTDTYPSCASPTIPTFDLESPIRRSRSLNLSYVGRTSADSASRVSDTIHRARTASIGDFAEEQARQLEALANALRALKSTASSRVDDSESSSCADEPRSWPLQPRRASCLEVPESPVSATLSRIEMTETRIAQSSSPATVIEEGVSDNGDRWAVRVAAPRRLKPTPPPVPPPPTAKRILMAGCGPSAPRSSESEESAARIRAGLFSTRVPDSLHAPASVTPGNEFEEDEDALSARLTRRTDGAYCTE
jgi:hypothetical protein